MVTRRVHKRQLLLVDDPKVQQIIEFTLGYCLQKHNIDLHAIVVEGNHFHQVDTDPDGDRPRFLQHFHSLVARQINRHFNQEDALFSNKQTSIVDNVTIHDVMQRIVYTMGNPVADGIEREGKHHKGIRMRWPQPDRVIQKPLGFWRPLKEGGVAPDEVTLTFARPPGWDGITDDELNDLLEQRVLAYEKEKREKREAEGIGFLCDTNKRTDPMSYPKSPSKLFGLSPLIGAALKRDRLAAIARLRDFRHKHDIARLRKKANPEEVVVFPHGTYLAVQRWSVPVEAEG